MLVDNPIINSPFEEPTRYWAYEEGQPIIVDVCQRIRADLKPVP